MSEPLTSRRPRLLLPPVGRCGPDAPPSALLQLSSQDPGTSAPQRPPLPCSPQTGPPLWLVKDAFLDHCGAWLLSPVVYMDLPLSLWGLPKPKDKFTTLATTIHKTSQGLWDHRTGWWSQVMGFASGGEFQEHSWGARGVFHGPCAGIEAPRAGGPPLLHHLGGHMMWPPLALSPLATLIFSLSHPRAFAHAVPTAWSVLS